LIEVKNLTKIYGQHKAVDNISFTVNDGEIWGFLGPNGAGKTTTMNMMTGFISATEGTVTINGHDILDDAVEAKKQLGYLPDVPPVYGDMRVDEYLDFVCDIKKVKKSKRAAMLDDITATVGITHVRNRIVKNLSKGYRQRVGLAQALVGYPSVLILDEPTVGLDPQQIIEMRQVIKKLGERHTILLSSHILSEVSAVCDKIMIINNGKIVASDTTENLEENAASNAYLIRAKGDEEKAVAVAEKIENVIAVEKTYCDEENCVELRVTGEKGADIRGTLVNNLVKAGIEVVMLKSAALTLEQVFLKVINGEYDSPLPVDEPTQDSNEALDNTDEAETTSEEIAEAVQEAETAPEEITEDIEEVKEEEE